MENGKALNENGKAAKRDEKTGGSFKKTLKRVLYVVFAHNAVLKITALVFSAALWILSTGLG
jgi:hypothetical protein